MKLILVRHGQTTSNVHGLLDTAVPGAPLTELGQQQAAALRDTVGTEPSLLDDGRPALFSSAATRAQQTATGLLTAPIVLDGLQEIAAGDWEMSNEDAAVEGYFTVMNSWMRRELTIATPGPTGESGRQFLKRVDKAIATVARETGSGDDRTAVVVCHGGVIRTWASLRSRNLPPTYGLSTGVPNTGVIRMLGTPERGWICTAWRDDVFDATGPHDPFADPMIVDTD